MTRIDAALARHKAAISGLSDTEVSAGLRMINSSLDMSIREAAVLQLVESSDNSREALAAWIDLYELFIAATPRDAN
jgi:hypothetical protein